MIPRPSRPPPRWWGPRLSRTWISFWRPWRAHWLRRCQRVEEVEVRGLDDVRRLLGQPLLLTPNHPGSPDPGVMYHVADQLGSPFFFMVAWELFGRSNFVVRRAVQHHGAFSVDRDGMDLRAFRQAVEILVAGKYPLVIFPEGEVYHVNDRVTPFRYGAAAIAIAAARRIKRPVNLIPTAIKYHYLGDPTPALLEIMDELEISIHWRPSDLSLAERIYRFGEGALAIKELEYIGRTCAGPVPQRVAALRNFILRRLENCYGVGAKNNTPPERVKLLRHRVITMLTQLPLDDPARSQCLDGLDDLLFVTQLYSYPGDYVAESPTIERIAETIDKFAEDTLGVSRASVCAARRATVQLGAQIQVTADDGGHDGTARLARLLEQRVQGLLDSIQPVPQHHLDSCFKADHVIGQHDGILSSHRIRTG